MQIALNQTRDRTHQYTGRTAANQPALEIFLMVLLVISYDSYWDKWKFMEYKEAMLITVMFPMYIATFKLV